MIITILESMQAVDSEGDPDRKLRLQAFNSAHKFLRDFLPSLDEGDKKQLAQGMSECMKKSLERDSSEASQIDELKDVTLPK